jgi:hyperosmotically inducible periplasmic protein
MEHFAMKRILLKRTLIALIAAGVLCVLPAASVAEAPASDGQEESSRSMGRAIDDANITAAVKSKLLADRATQGLRINVTTRNGVVSLTGQVRSTTEKELAEQMATDTSGVKAVENRLEVKMGG